MKALRIFLALAASLFLLSGSTLAQESQCVDKTQEDEIEDFQRKIHDAKRSVVRLRVINRMLLEKSGQDSAVVDSAKRIDMHRTGWGVVVEGQSGQLYVATLMHVVHFNPHQTLRALRKKFPRKLQDFSVKRSIHAVYIETESPNPVSGKLDSGPEVTVAARPGDTDGFAVFELPSSLAGEVKPANLVRSRRCLGINTAVWIVGSSQPADSAWGLEKFDVNHTHVTNVGAKNYSRIQKPLYNEYSGSPLFAYHDGRLKVVGLSKAWIGTRFMRRAVSSGGVLYKIDPLITVLGDL